MIQGINPINLIRTLSKLTCPERLSTSPTQWTYQNTETSSPNSVLEQDMPTAVEHHHIAMVPKHPTAKSSTNGGA